MKPALFVAILTLGVLWSASAEPPLKVTVPQLLAHPLDYEGRAVDVSGYYRCSYHGSNLWLDASTAKNTNLDLSVFIDPATWDSSLPPKQSKDISDPWHVTGHRAHVIGTFRSRLVPPGIPTTGGWGPSITDVSYFRRAK